MSNYYLTEIQFEHNARKDAERGIKEYIICKQMESKIDYINKQYFYEELFEDGDKEASFYPTDKWVEENKEVIECACFYDITKDEFDVYNGTKKNIILWLQSNMWIEHEDYEGWVSYDWSKCKKITEQQMQVLLDLNIAKRID